MNSQLPPGELPQNFECEEGVPVPVVTLDSINGVESTYTVCSAMVTSANSPVAQTGGLGVDNIPSTWTASPPEGTAQPGGDAPGEQEVFGQLVASPTEPTSSGEFAGTTGLPSSTKDVKNGTAEAEVKVSSVSEPSTGNDAENRYAPGAVAGIAIATMIIGATLAFLAAWFLFKRKHRKQIARGQLSRFESAPSLMLKPPPTSLNSPYTPIPAMSSANISLGGRHADTALTPPTAVALGPMMPPATTRVKDDALANILPPPANRADIQSRLSELFAKAHHHVDTFYRDIHISITPSMETELAKIGMGDVGMVELLQTSSRPTVAIKHALVAYMLGITDPGGAKEETLFPTGVMGIEGSKKMADVAGEGQKDLTPSVIIHQRLSTHLYRSLSHTSRCQVLQPTVRDAAEHFALTFFPWANPIGDDQEKDKGLIGIIYSTLDTMVWLYGQPYLSTEFVWDAGGGNLSRTVIAPGLLAEVYEDGKVKRDGILMAQYGAL